MRADSRSVAVVTGTRAEFGLLRPVMYAIAAHERLRLKVIVTGTHLLPPAHTAAEVQREFEIAATVRMQNDGPTTRATDAQALGRGIGGIAEALENLQPDVVLVLGDRIEAFAAAAAAAVSGVRVAHMHGGDRAEGIADESLRHAITKLAHIHLPATSRSAMRIIAMGEQTARVHIVGSPAIDGLKEIEPLSDQQMAALGSPRVILLMHPVGDAEQVEQARMQQLIAAACAHGSVLVLHPNHDPGRDGIVRAIIESGCNQRSHLPREQFIGLLKRAQLIVGNSSAGLIECAALGVRALNIGQRQGGREFGSNVVHWNNSDYQTLGEAVKTAMSMAPPAAEHPFGTGDSGPRTAAILADFDPDIHGLGKLNTY